MRNLILGKLFLLTYIFIIYWGSSMNLLLILDSSLNIYIYYKYSTLLRGILVYIALKVGIFPEAGGRGKYSLLRVQYMRRHFTRVRVEYLVYYIGYIRSDVPIDHAQYQGWNIGVEFLYIFHPYGPI